jgi:hypothetical protein
MEGNLSTTLKIELALLSMILFVIGLIVYEAVNTHADVSAFHKGDCFKLAGPVEDWQHTPDGIIERVGKKNYLFLWKDQAEKRGGSKYGATIDIKVFDELHVKVPCPETWVTHTHL